MDKSNKNDAPTCQENVDDSVLTDLPNEVVLTKEEFEEARSHIEMLKKEHASTVALAQRIQADFDNFRKRNATIHIDSIDEGARDVVRSLLPVIDNFDRAWQNADGIDPQWIDGIKLVFRQFMETLTKQGLEEIPTDGKFDPELHEAVMQEEVEDAQSGDIVETLQKGYKFKERIIRHSMVKVAK